MFDRKKIAAKMRSLAQLTVDNGCSQEEAASALALLASLQSKYNLTLDAIELEAEEPAFIACHIRNENVYQVAAAIAKATDTRAVIADERKVVFFFGTQHDVEYANYLMAIVDAAAHTAFNKFILDPQYKVLRNAKQSEQIIRLSYTIGIVTALGNRILAMLKPIELHSSTGQELMIIKANKAQEFMDSMGLNETKAVSTEIALISSVADKGAKDAESIALNKGIANNNSNNTNKVLN